jgi:formiminotetrahydrofolate cyclodeaminase
MDLKGLTVEAFTRKLAGGSATPGGGSAAALAGALGACLCAMTARLTAGRKKFEAVWEEMEGIQQEADALAARLLELVDEDARAYERVMVAFKMPQQDAAGKAARTQALQEAMKGAAWVPFETLQSVTRAAELAKGVLEKGNPNCLSDAGVGGQLLRAAALGAGYNVRINLNFLKDREFTARLETETGQLLKKVLSVTGGMEKKVKQSLT